MPPLTGKILTSAEPLRSCRFDFFTGVACSLLAPLIEALEARPPGYVPAVREDLALGMAAGAYLAGAWPAVLMQNSGLGYSLNVLTSLHLICRIPTLLVVGHRGYQGKDAPEHLVMGAHGREILEAVGIPTFAPEPGGWAEAVERAGAVMQERKIPAAVFLRKGVL